MVPSDRPRASSQRARRSARCSSVSLGVHHLAGLPGGGHVVLVGPGADGHAGQVGGAEGGGLEHRRDLDGPAAGVGQRLGEDRDCPTCPRRRGGGRWAVPSRPPPPRAGRRPGGPPPPAPPAPARGARCPGSARRRCPGPRSPRPGCPARAGPGRTRRRRCPDNGPATSAEWAAVSMMPRSSRSHSTQVPADSMMASTPQVISAAPPPGDDRDGAGRAPGRLRGPLPARRTGRACPPVPKVALAWPGSGAALPDEGGLLVAGQPGDDRPARQDLGRPHRPRGVDDGGEEGFGDAEGGQHLGSSSPSRRRWISPVTPALDASVTWSAPAERVQATQVSTVPKASSPRSERERSGSAWSRMAATLVAEALGATRMPRPWSSRQVPTVRRSCQPSPGATGIAGGPVPHDGGGPLVGDAHGLDRPALGQAGRAPPRPRRRPWPAASNSTRPGNGVSGSTGTWWTWVTSPSGRTTAPRTPEVPTSTTRTLMARAPVRRGP